LALASASFVGYRDQTAAVTARYESANRCLSGGEES
jgi:hypothetical protein